jgi:hypothetical protein
MRARPALQNAIRPLPNIWLHKIRVRGWDSPPPGPAGPAAVSLTFNNANGQASLAVMMALERDLLSATASVIWIAALCAVLGFHCGHLFHTRGERRGYHCTHVVMLLGMLHMYAAVAFGLDLLPAPVWMIVYAVTSAVIIGWMLVRLLRRHSFGYLWILALVQQAAMIYMWVPMAYWVPRLPTSLPCSSLWKQSHGWRRRIFLSLGPASLLYRPAGQPSYLWRPNRRLAASA